MRYKLEDEHIEKLEKIRLERGQSKNEFYFDICPGWFWRCIKSRLVYGRIKYRLEEYNIMLKPV